MKSLAWQDDAACSRIGGNAWFPKAGDNGHAAARACRGCPVRTECLDYALANDEREGIWGGLTPNGRRALTRDAVAC